MNKMIGLLALSAGLMLGQPAGTPPQPNVTDIKAYLGLTDAQVTSLTQLLQTERQSVQSLMQQVGQKRQALDAALKAGTSNAATLGQFLLDIQALEKQIEQKRTDSRTQALAVLTADQKTKLNALSAAEQLLPSIREAGMLNLLAPPQGAGPGGPGFRGGPGGRGGPRGFGGARGPAGFRRMPPPPADN